ncbi:MAG: hypothetical protein KBA75_04200 [Alphaproteobacteria bacterium]|nr:hypothetical protein [Alphaproteobacteria bacterium]
MRLALCPSLALMLCALLPHGAGAEEIPNSLFLTAVEQQDHAAPHPTKPGRTSLDALVYYGPDQWQVWINGQAYKPDSQSDALAIIAVTAEAVTLEQKRDAEPVRFTLAPHQSYDWAEQRVVEGAP